MDNITRRELFSLSGGTAKTKPKVEFDTEVDVIVVGAGASGASAALFAHDAGADVLILEKGPVLGGTSAKSAGQIWIPDNRTMHERGLTEDRNSYFGYIARYSYPQSYNPNSPSMGIPKNEYELVSKYFDNAKVMLERLTEMGAVKYQPPYLSSSDKTATPNYFTYDKDKTPAGRTLGPIDQDGKSAGGSSMMRRFGIELKKRNIPIKVRHEASEILQNSKGEVIGLKVLHGGKSKLIRARRGVIFTTGGYAQNKEMLKQFHNGEIFGTCATPSATGDFVTLGMDIGAKLGNMAGGWRAEVVLEETYQGLSLAEDVFFILADSSFYVNRHGKRFINERINYQDRTKDAYKWDPNKVEYPNLLRFCIYDQRVADYYGGTYPVPAKPDGADYVIKADTVEGLALALEKRLTKLGNPGGISLDEDFSTNLEATMLRFNKMARAGKDEDFNRGDSSWDRYWTDNIPSNNPFPNKALHPLKEEGPYYAIILAPGLLDTNGGPVINADAQVLDSDDNPIPGLYGAGNCIASPAANSYWGAGVTLGLGMTFGMIAGENAAKGKEKESHV